MGAVAYWGLLAGAFLIAVAGSWYFSQLDNYAYDFFLRAAPPAAWQPEAIILAIDEQTLVAEGGMRNLRAPLAEGLRLLAPVHPKAIAVDIILADRSDPATDAALASAIGAAGRVVLSSELIDGGKSWENPLPEFRRAAAAVAHVHAQPDDNDAITRSIPLEKRSGTDRRWALALEAFRLSANASIVETPSDLQVGGTVIPARGGADGRLMRVRFVPYAMPRVSLRDLLAHPERAREFAGRTVFIGVTASTEVRDRLFTPFGYGASSAGIEINAAAFETMRRRLFLVDASEAVVLLFSLLLVAALGCGFRYLSGWWVYAAAGVVLVLAHLAPYWCFERNVVLSFATPASSAWLGGMTAAAYYHLVVRRRMLSERSTRERYQQAMHFVTHEMRTPLSAIQGSSELISRFALNDDKRKQIALLINSESKRLARMVEIFLNVERLSAGQMELKHEAIAVGELIAVCVERAAPLATRKRISMACPLPLDAALLVTGDRELMEYACYNLLTNAVKYSPQETEVTVSAWRDGALVKIAVRDQGIGMDQKEVKQIFQKFYRTRKAEQSGEAGSGIGLSIVQQIVEQHGGHIDVVSEPGAGSSFTLVLPAAAAVSSSQVGPRP
jgi:signal transduction histidine kinase